MARRTPTQKLDEIAHVLRAHPDGMSAPEIAHALAERGSERTLQNHFARYGLRPVEFNSWHAAWTGGGSGQAG
ncbi:hypothetical protein [Luteitalea sp.]|jgi:repressor of nif and glnA expression|uniref:hypothetical protein n=1 Tax=Luteitalea sp. TaxID=2004800 RepID=UPI0037CA7D9B